MNKVILMKFTSRGRPSELIKCIKSYVDLAGDLKNMVWLFTFDANDASYNSTAFTDSIRTIINGHIQIVFGDSADKINAINRDVNDFKFKWDILLNISDDQLPVVQGYDDIIREAMPDDLDWSLWFNDGHQMRISTQEILGYSYYQRDKFIYDPRFKSFFCDNVSTMLAAKRGRVIKSPQCIIKHFHPQWEKDTHMKKDQLYLKNDSFWNEDKRLFYQLQRGLL